MQHGPNGLPFREDEYDADERHHQQEKSPERDDD